MRFCFFTNARTSSNDAEDSNRSVLYPMFPAQFVILSAPAHAIIGATKRLPITAAASLRNVLVFIVGSQPDADLRPTPYTLPPSEGVTAFSFCRATSWSEKLFFPD